MKREVAIFGAGCFWQPELEFSKVEGVLKTEVGFMGGDGSFKKLSYKRVCGGGTGHIEVVRVEFDSEKVSYKNLLDIFWKIHNPTQKNRQGLDIGRQYHSSIFYLNEKQKKAALASKVKKEAKTGKNWIGKKKKIMTEVKKAGKFYKAEEYHQKYLEKQGRKAR